MADVRDERGVLLQSLQDAGCDHEMIEKCMKMTGKDEQKKMLAELKKFRTSALENLHREQEKLNCLDYLIYELEK